MGFSTKECAWKSVEVKMLGRTFVGIKGFEFSKSIEKEYLYGAGSEPIDIQEGNRAYPGHLKLLKYEVDMLNEAAAKAGYEDITEVPHEAIAITCNFKKNAGDPTKTITAMGVAFSENKIGMEQGGKFSEVTLPFLSMKTTIK